MKIKYLRFLLFIIQITFAQNPFEHEIQFFQKNDSLNIQKKDNCILFLGSSSIRLWDTLSDDFYPANTLNRGFGGATLLDMIHFKKQIIDSYKPLKIVIYCGENDLANDDSLTPKQVKNRFKKLFRYIRKTHPAVPIIYISIKPSPSRWSLKEKMIETNKLIQKYVSLQNNSYFVDVWSKMLNYNKEPDIRLFVDDLLHLNKLGYKIWKEELTKILIK